MTIPRRAVCYYAIFKGSAQKGCAGNPRLLFHLIYDSLKEMEIDMLVMMHRIMDKLKKRGQGLAEYILILALVSIVTMFMLMSFERQMDSTFSKISSGLAP
jgi:Flp pilus assembly pilin Flp